MSNTENKTKDKRIKTGSIALRIALGSALYLLLAFLVVDIAVMIVEAWPQIETGADPAAVLRSAFSACKDVVTSRRFDIVLQIEGVIVLLRLILDLLRIRKQLKPLDEMARAAMDLSNIDVSIDDRFQKLESAIDRLSPAEEDAALATGDAELEGLESAVNKLVERMRDAYRQQARFVSDASHELRTPIAVIKGYADMLDRWGKEDEAILEESIQAIKTESDAMQHLVEQLLFLARGDSGRTPVVHLKDFVRAGGELKSVAAGTGEMDYSAILSFLKARKPYVQATLENTDDTNAVQARAFIERAYTKM